MGTTGTNGAENTKTIVLDEQGYAGYMQWMADTKKRNVANKLDDMGTIKAHNRRQTLVMRRTKKRWETIAPEVDIAAYGEIYKLKNPSADPKQKTNVTDNEIKAYKVLDPDFKAAPTLEDIAEMVAVMKASGEASEEGDVAGEEEEAHAAGEGEEGEGATGSGGE